MNTRKIDYEEKDVVCFWNNVNKLDENDCWEWNGIKNRDRYGQLVIKKKM